jgi:hypothetical protein
MDTDASVLHMITRPQSCLELHHTYNYVKARSDDIILILFNKGNVWRILNLRNNSDDAATGYGLDGRDSTLGRNGRFFSSP